MTISDLEDLHNEESDEPDYEEAVDDALGLLYRSLAVFEVVRQIDQEFNILKVSEWRRMTDLMSDIEDFTLDWEMPEELQETVDE